MDDSENGISKRPQGSVAEGARKAADEERKVRSSHMRDRQTWRLVVGLVGLLGAVWALAIANRIPNLLPG